MKRSIKNIISACCLSGLALTLTGCLETAMPESGQVSQEQLQKADKSSLSDAISNYMLTYGSNYYDIGFMGFSIWRDAMTADLPGIKSGYYYFSFFSSQIDLGDWMLQTLFWQRYYYLNQKCSGVLSVSDMTPGSADTEYVGNALAYRAMIYMDLMRHYEYRRTGVAELDARAEQRGIYGLTVPIVTETTTEADARNLPRAHVTEMYRFIMNDLNLAEKCLKDYRSVAVKTNACRGVVYGLKARLWLEMGSRYQNDPDILAMQLSMEGDETYAHYDRLNIQTAKDCFAKAQEYARLAINEGFTPLSKGQWYDTANGFNTPNNAWMWCITVGSDDPLATSLTWKSWPSFMSPEPTYGVSNMTYQGTKMIDARLFGTIDEGDWRRDTWIDPADAGNESAFNEKYAKTTNLPYSTWKDFPGYVGFKFHPATGNYTTASAGNAVSVPMMRVEEMYLIEAEAAAYAVSPSYGAQLLEQFLNSYRYDEPYTVPSTQLEDLVAEIFKHKRIEFWGEGIVLWDYRRNLYPIVKGYPGTNHIEAYRSNSYAGFVAPWTTLYIPDREVAQNPAIIPNPDPSLAIPKWTASTSDE